MKPTTPYWFHAKRYGWGWGLPARREGWIVFVTWLLLICTLGPWLISRSVPAYLAFMAIMTVVIIAICFAKGEPPKWRWGK